MPIDPHLVDRVYEQSGAPKWQVDQAAFAAALQRSVDRACAGKNAAEVAGYVTALHVEDLALACACAAGHEPAWDHFVLHYRPQLYRAAEAIDRSTGARELADSLYADLYGINSAGAGRQSLFRYFHGRSTLATWLRAVLSQRHVDRLRAERRFEPLDERHGEPPAAAMLSAESPSTPAQTLVAVVLAMSIAALPSRDRLRLRCYYAQQMTLAEIGRLLNEHEGTASRNVARSRQQIQLDVLRRLREDHKLTEAESKDALRAAMDDSGAMDVMRLFAEERKKSAADRSNEEGMP